MKFRTIVIAILLYLLAATLFNCSPRVVRDSKLLGKIKSRSPELFKTETDTVYIEGKVDSIGMFINTDTADFINRLNHYVDVVDSLEKLSNRLDEASFQDRKTLFATKQRLTLELSKGYYKPTTAPLIDPKGRFHMMVKFDPESNSFSVVEGTFKDRTIKTKETITIRVKPTMWEAFKSLWPVWAIIVLLGIVVGVIKYLTR